MNGNEILLSPILFLFLHMYYLNKKQKDFKLLLSDYRSRPSAQQTRTEKRSNSVRFRREQELFKKEPDGEVNTF